MTRKGPASLGVLGPLEVRGPAGEVVEIPRGRRRMLLAVLAAQRGRIVPADQLFEAVWGDAPGDRSSTLHSSVSRLRRSLPANFDLVTHPAGYRLDVAGDDVDARRFEEALERARQAAGTGPVTALAELEAGLELWRGRAFDGVEDRLGVEGMAARLEELRVAAREERVQLLITAGRSVDAVAAAEELVRAQPGSDRCCELLMLALYAWGRHADALVAYRRHLERLADAGLEPTAALVALEGRVLRHEVPLAGAGAAGGPDSAGADAAGPGTAEGPGAPGRQGTAPPLPVSTFVGRDVELDAVVRLVRRSRLVTLVGPGGVGKTRLALHVAAALADDHPDGVWYAELAQVSDPDAVPAAMAAALGIEQRAGVSLSDRVVDALRTRRALVVIDNCEHVLEAAATFAEALLQRTRDVRLLATSREALVVDGEQRWPVRPLAVPAQDGDGGAAVELFRDRATAVLGAFEPSAEDLERIEWICRRVDGLPLGIELAAARIGALGIAGVAEGLHQPLQLLNRGRRTATARHRSLREVVAWSYDLLEPHERELFDAVCVFAGDFTAASAAVVAGPGVAGSAGAAPVADVLADLVERSLVVRRDTPDGPRYALLETLRAFGVDQLVARGELDAIRDRHAAHVVAFAEEADRGLRGPDEGLWVRRLDAELPQLRAAHQHLLGAGDSRSLLRLSASLHAYGWLRFRTEVGDWAAEAAAAGPFGLEDGPRLQPYVLGAAALSTSQRGDVGRGEAMADAALDLAGHDDPSARVAWEALGDARLLRRDIEGAIEAYERSLRASEAAGDLLQQTIAVVNVSLALAFAGRPTEAGELAAKARRLAGASGMPSALSWARFAAGVALGEADPAASMQALDAAVALAHQVDASLLVGAVGLTAARAHTAQGDHGRAIDLFEQLVEHFRRSGAWMQQWTTLRNLVVLLARRGEEAAAATLVGAATASGMATPNRAAEAQVAAALEEAEARLGAPRCAELVEAGSHLDEQDVIDLAVEAMARVRSTLG